MALITKQLSHVSFVLSLIFIFNVNNVFGNDTLVFKRDKVIIDENVGIPQYAWASAYKMAHLIELNSDVFEFDGFLSICFNKNEYTKKYSSDTLITATVGWIFNPLTDTSMNGSNYYYYDRYIKWWTQAFISKFIKSERKPDKTTSFMYYSSGTRDFIYDKRYFLNTNLFESNPDFYTKDNSTEICQIYKCKFEAVILNYNLEDKSFKVLMPVSEAFEFRPVNSTEAQSIGYIKSNSVIVLE